MGLVKGLATLSLLASASAKVFFQEKFDAGWEDRWTKSTWKTAEGTAGEFTATAGKWHGGDGTDMGIQTGPDARFYALSAAADETFSNAGVPLVLQFSVKHEQGLDCGGGYIKLLPASSSMEDFSGDTPYSIMFGPDICGSSTKRVHVIFNYKGENLLTKKTISCETDKLTHVYTLIVNPDKSYQVLIDNVEKASGHMEDDWDFLQPATIKDPSAVKPDDWDERAQIVDPEDVKPEGYDDIPEKLADPEAEKPDDWDDEDDGEWEAPMIDNPEFKGPWKPKMIDNPDYKGVWVAPDIPNPDYEGDDTLHVYNDLKYVGFELWQVKSGSIFDNILVTDDVELAKTFAEETWGAMKDAEKEMFDAAEELAKKEAEEAAKKAEEERKALEEEEDDEDDDEEEDEEEEEPEHDEL
jgi:calreticulin